VHVASASQHCGSAPRPLHDSVAFSDMPQLFSGQRAARSALVRPMGSGHRRANG
jgi:hypothetical protein